MSRRRKKGGGHENHERWLITYADLITLLMIFFVVMYAMSAVDQSKFDSLSISLNKALHPSNQIQIDSMGNSGIISKKTKEGEKESKEENKTAGELKQEQEQQRLEDLKKKVENFIRENNLGGQINVLDTERGVQITLNDAALFASGSADLKVEAQRILGGMAPFLRIVPNRVSVEGHTDNVPINNSRFPSNWELSAVRAINVLHDLEREGVPAARMFATGYADTMPLKSNDTVENRAANRRVNLIVLRQYKAESIAPFDKDKVIQP
ncbi:flagellar motor protein MotB [Tumebacillus lipolyticus]|uniref:Flagellar motor protein MotB n=1 Tax=Tumebacillus lipolyticus TaxID=1280370 RepID=A0ABW5A349_9BACL